MNNNSLSIRNADINDADLLYAWANDMDVRMNSFSKEDFSYDDHLAWYKEKLNNPNCLMFIASMPKSGDDEAFYMEDVSDYLSKDSFTKATMADSLGAPGEDSISALRLRQEKAIGQVRLDITDGVAQIDYSVDSRYRGRGFGKELLNLATGIKNKDIHTFQGLVKIKNKASQKAFEAAGFKNTGQGEKNKMPYLVYEKSYQDFGTSTVGKGKTILICTVKSWNIRNAQIFANRFAGIHDTYVITSGSELTPQAVDDISPDLIFFPHWSSWIPEEIFNKYECIAFHMSDLPYGRGGSPLQNLIARGHKETKISALRVEPEFDAGPIYMKEPLSLAGTAHEIFKRASDIIFHSMIPALLRDDRKAIPQQGDVTVFKRRKPEDGRLSPDMSLNRVYDYIRMLDGEGYPPAFMEFNESCVMEFTGSKYDPETGTLEARVIFKPIAPPQ